MKKKQYAGIYIIIFIFGILVIPKILQRIKNDDIVKSDRLNNTTNKEMTERSAGLKVMGKAPAFSLTNQENNNITNDDFKGKVYVLEFFFSTCPTICPKMNQNMKIIEKEFLQNKDFGIASITINPEYDTPKILAEHAEALGIQSKNWHFLTGKKETIFDLANKGFNVYVGQNDKVSGGFEHSGLFALIDKNGNIRCRYDAYGNPIMYYDGLEKEGINALIEDIKILLNE